MTYSEKHEEYEDKFRLITAKFDGEIYNQMQLHMLVQIFIGTIKVL